MTDEQYRATQEMIVSFAAMINRLDLAGLIRRIDEADAVGPVLDPTLYRRGVVRMHRVRRLAVAMQSVQAAVHAIGREVMGDA